MNYKFHNVYFSDREQLSIIQYAESRDWTLADVLQQTVEKDWKVSFSWDNFHSAALLSITPKKETEHMFGYIVSVRHVDIYTLGKVLLWFLADGWEALDVPEESSSKFGW